MPELVTIGIPIYRRLEHLPHVLKVVEAQDYPSVELIVSDNGQNGDKVLEIVETHYSRPYRLRRNPSTVSPAVHFNQIIGEASGEYFVLLMDDDEISSNYVSELVRQFENVPGATIAFAGQESIDENGAVIRRSMDSLPTSLPGPEFISAMWDCYEFGFDVVATFLAKTEDIKSCGAYPDFARGSHIENGLVTKLCLLGDVVFSSKCVFRWRDVGASYGWTVGVDEFAAATRGFLRFLNHDAIIRKFTSEHPAQAEKVKRCLAQMAWGTYLWRWRDIYRHKLSYPSWVAAAFAMPFIAAYYKQVLRVLVRAAIGPTKIREEGLAAHGV